MNGSGDTSYAWTLLKLLPPAFTGRTLLWSLAEGRRKNYNRIAWWFKTILKVLPGHVLFFLRVYQVVSHANALSRATAWWQPGGDLLPMRLSWIWYGLFGRVPVFAGAMEVLAGCLMLFRRTATAGTLLAAGVFKCGGHEYQLWYSCKTFSQHLFFARLVFAGFWI